MKNTQIKGTLEIDHDRSVIYFHAAEGPQAGISVLRLQGLPKLPKAITFVDVNVLSHEVGVTTKLKKPRKR